MEENKIIESREIRYVFSNSEAADLGKKLASQNAKINELEETKKASASQYAASINAEKEQLNVLNRKVGNGYEARFIDCEVQYHVPEKGIKTLTRTDLEDEEDLRGMDKVWTERMEDLDWDRWNDKVRDVECTVEMHSPDIDKKTYTQTSTGHKFIEQMSQVDIENWEAESTETLNHPEEGQKTFVHNETGLIVQRRMSPEDIDRLQTSMFEEDEENDLGAAPTVGDETDDQVVESVEESF